jgi:Tetratricopeptide repeat
LIDDAFYGERGTPFVWVIAGLAVFSQPTIRTMTGLLTPYLHSEGLTPVQERRMQISLVAAFVVTISAFVVLSWRHLTAAWLANLGAVRMARVQLSIYPTNEWEDDHLGVSLESAQNLFEHAASLDPANQTALYRLGLIAMQNQDFKTAIDYLDSAYRLDAGHRGVAKQLGYAYVWAGQYERAQALLAHVKEARWEMEAYSSWWMIRNRPDLAHNAEEMARRLATVNSIQPDVLASRLAIP